MPKAVAIINSAKGYMKTLHVFSNVRRIALYGTLGTVIGSTFLFVFTRIDDEEIPTIEKRARVIMDACADAAHKPSCYDGKIASMTADMSLKDSFAVADIIQKRDDVYGTCHLLGHNLAIRETAKDPLRWKDVIAECPRSMCRNGCVHGAFQAHFGDNSFEREEELQQMVADLRTVCEERPGWQPTPLDKGTCYHAIGHSMLYVGEADITRSLALCRDIAGDAYKKVCLDGLFMQLFQPIAEEDRLLVENVVPPPQERAVREFCGQFSKQAHASCWTNAWAWLFFEGDGSVNDTPVSVEKFCGAAGDVFSVTYCRENLFYIIASWFQLDRGRIEEFCRGLSRQEYQAVCFAKAAERFMEAAPHRAREAVGMCAAAPEPDAKNACYQAIAGAVSFMLPLASPYRTDVCAALPEPWRDRSDCE